MPRKAASAKPHRAAKRKPHLSYDNAPDKETSHSYNSSSIYNISVQLQTSAQGGGNMSLGRPPPTDTTRNIKSSGVLDEDEKCKEEKEQQANKGKEEQHLSQEEDQDSARSQQKWWRTRSISFLLTPETRPDASPRRHSLIFHSILLVLALFSMLSLAPNGSQPKPAPVPEYTLIKPLDPSPDVSFTKLLQRHAMIPFTIVQSNATDMNVYKDLLWDTDEYCRELRLKLVADWAHVLPTTNGQQWWSWRTRKYDDTTFHGVAYEHTMALCDDFHTLLRPLAPEVVVPLHAFIVNYWGVHAVTAMLSASSSLAKLFSTQMNDMLLLDSPTPSTTSILGNDNLAANQALNDSLAITVLKELSHQVTLPREWSDIAIENIKTLNASIDKVVILGKSLLEPTWQQWISQNESPGYNVKDQARKLSEKDLEHLSSLRNQAQAKLSILKSVQTQFSGPATEALEITGAGVNKLKEWMDSLIAGKGWTQLVQDEEEKWVLDWYYFPLRRDLPDWVKNQAQNLTLQLKKFVHK